MVASCLASSQSRWRNWGHNGKKECGLPPLCSQWQRNYVIARSAKHDEAIQNKIKQPKLVNKKGCSIHHLWYFFIIINYGLPRFARNDRGMVFFWITSFYRNDKNGNCVFAIITLFLIIINHRLLCCAMLQWRKWRCNNKTLDCRGALCLSMIK
jgi:hypothetical protein